MTKVSCPHRRRPTHGLLRWLCTLAVAGVATILAPPTPAQADLPRLVGCSWPTKFATDANSIAFPDSAASYWASVVRIPTGGHVEISGRYPHARYFSVTTYSATTQSVDGLYDTAIGPDDGGVNPYLPGADRTSAHRDFTVRLVDGAAPRAGRPDNTLYTTSADGLRTSPPGLAIVVWRVYVPDDGADQAGGVPLPNLVAVEAGGARRTLEPCPGAAPTAVDTGISDLGRAPTAAVTDPAGTYGDDPPGWEKFTGLAQAVADGVARRTVGGQVIGPLADRFGDGGFFDNPDNKYVVSNADAGFGPVLVLRGRAPTAPRTADGTPTMGTGQVRYWSICTEDLPTTGYLGCAHDEEIPVDEFGYYTIVISAVDARPSTANTECGVTWLPAGGRQQTMVLLRNMLPDPSFPASVQRATPGQEKATMGHYLPVGRYYQSAAAFDRLGCGSAGVTPGWRG